VQQVIRRLRLIDGYRDHMRFSVWPALSNPIDEVLEIARHGEETGWDGVWVADHFMSNGDRATGSHEAFTVLAAIAARVPRLQLGTLVAGNTFRHPAITANMAAAIDHISGGRFVLGLGAGWQVNEHEAYGIPLGTVRERLDRFEEACIVITSLFRNDRTTFSGDYYTLDDAPLVPRPIREPIPLMVGGGGEKRTMRIAAQYADRWNYWGTPKIVAHKLDVLGAHCDAVGRDRKDISCSSQAQLYMSEDRAWLDAERTRLENTVVGVGRRGIDSALVGTPEEIRDVVAEYVELGLDELIIPDFGLGSLDERKRSYDVFRERVIDALG
jgi:F420-dependent oxidoreductase-like protein